jgi:hypothetical protein
MKTHTPAFENAMPKLRIHEPTEEEAASVETVELEDQRQKIKDQTQAEDFWAGRNLGDRKSARIAA